MRHPSRSTLAFPLVALAVAAACGPSTSGGGGTGGSGGGASGTTSAGQCLPTNAECDQGGPCCEGECLILLGCGSDCLRFCQLPPYCSAPGGPCRGDSDCCMGSCLGVISNVQAGSCGVGDAGADG